MIAIDQDGVLANFISSALKVFGISEEEIMKIWTPGVWEIDKIIGISEDEFYKKIEAQGEDYWANLEPLPWRDELWDMCAEIEQTTVLTTPTDHAACLSGKLRWLHKWKHASFRDYIVAPSKERCARWDWILIDDRDENVVRFRKNGGSAIVFPCITNSQHEHKDNPMAYVKKELLKWKEEMKHKLRDYDGYSWIKVKNLKHDDSKTVEQKFKDLEDHHIAETSFLIDEVRRIASQRTIHPG